MRTSLRNVLRTIGSLAAVALGCVCVAWIVSGQLAAQEVAAVENSPSERVSESATAETTAPPEAPVAPEATAASETAAPLRLTGAFDSSSRPLIDPQQLALAGQLNSQELSPLVEAHSAHYSLQWRKDHLAGDASIEFRTTDAGRLTKSLGLGDGQTRWTPHPFSAHLVASENSPVIYGLDGLPIFDVSVAQPLRFSLRQSAVLSEEGYLAELQLPVTAVGRVDLTIPPPWHLAACSLPAIASGDDVTEGRTWRIPVGQQTALQLVIADGRYGGREAEMIYRASQIDWIFRGSGLDATASFVLDATNTPEQLTIGLHRDLKLRSLDWDGQNIPWRYDEAKHHVLIDVPATQSDASVAQHRLNLSATASWRETIELADLPWIRIAGAVSLEGRGSISLQSDLELMDFRLNEANVTSTSGSGGVGKLNRVDFAWMLQHPEARLRVRSRLQEAEIEVLHLIRVAARQITCQSHLMLGADDSAVARIPITADSGWNFGSITTSDDRYKIALRPGKDNRPIELTIDPPLQNGTLPVVVESTAPPAATLPRQLPFWTDQSDALAAVASASDVRVEPTLAAIDLLRPIESAEEWQRRVLEKWSGEAVTLFASRSGQLPLLPLASAIDSLSAYSLLTIDPDRTDQVGWWVYIDPADDLISGQLIRLPEYGGSLLWRVVPARSLREDEPWNALAIDREATEVWLDFGAGFAEPIILQCLLQQEPDQPWATLPELSGRIVQSRLVALRDASGGGADSGSWQLLTREADARQAQIAPRVTDFGSVEERLLQRWSGKAEKDPQGKSLNLADVAVYRLDMQQSQWRTLQSAAISGEVLDEGTRTLYLDHGGQQRLELQLLACSPIDRSIALEIGSQWRLVDVQFDGVAGGSTQAAADSSTPDAVTRLELLPFAGGDQPVAWRQLTCTFDGPDCGGLSSVDLRMPDMRFDRPIMQLTDYWLCDDRYTGSPPLAPQAFSERLRVLWPPSDRWLNNETDTVEGPSDSPPASQALASMQHVAYDGTGVGQPRSAVWASLEWIVTLKRHLLFVAVVVVAIALARLHPVLVLAGIGVLLSPLWQTDIVSLNVAVYAALIGLASSWLIGLVRHRFEPENDASGKESVYRDGQSSEQIVTTPVSPSIVLWAAIVFGWGSCSSLSAAEKVVLERRGNSPAIEMYLDPETLAVQRGVALSDAVTAEDNTPPYELHSAKHRFFEADSNNVYGITTLLLESVYKFTVTDAEAEIVLPRNVTDSVFRRCSIDGVEVSQARQLSSQSDRLLLRPEKVGPIQVVLSFEARVLSRDNGRMAIQHSVVPCAGGELTIAKPLQQAMLEFAHRGGDGKVQQPLDPAGARAFLPAVDRFELSWSAGEATATPMKYDQETYIIADQASPLVLTVLRLSSGDVGSTIPLDWNSQWRPIGSVDQKVDQSLAIQPSSVGRERTDWPVIHASERDTNPLEFAIYWRPSNPAVTTFNLPDLRIGGVRPTLKVVRLVRRPQNQWQLAGTEDWNAAPGPSITEQRLKLPSDASLVSWRIPADGTDATLTRQDANAQTSSPLDIAYHAAIDPGQLTVTLTVAAADGETLPENLSLWIDRRLEIDQSMLVAENTPLLVGETSARYRKVTVLLESSGGRQRIPLTATMSLQPGELVGLPQIIPTAELNSCRFRLTKSIGLPVVIENTGSQKIQLDRIVRELNDNDVEIIQWRQLLIDTTWKRDRSAESTSGNRPPLVAVEDRLAAFDWSELRFRLPQRANLKPQFRCEAKYKANAWAFEIYARCGPAANPGGLLVQVDSKYLELMQFPPSTLSVGTFGDQAILYTDLADDEGQEFLLCSYELSTEGNAEVTTPAIRIVNADRVTAQWSVPETETRSGAWRVVRAAAGPKRPQVLAPVTLRKTARSIGHVRVVGGSIVWRKSGDRWIGQGSVVLQAATPTVVYPTFAGRQAYCRVVNDGDAAATWTPFGSTAADASSLGVHSRTQLQLLLIADATVPVPEDSFRLVDSIGSVIDRTPITHSQTVSPENLPNQPALWNGQENHDALTAAQKLAALQPVARTASLAAVVLLGLAWGWSRTRHKMLAAVDRFPALILLAAALICFAFWPTYLPAAFVTALAAAVAVVNSLTSRSA